MKYSNQFSDISMHLISQGPIETVRGFCEVFIYCFRKHQINLELSLLKISPLSKSP